MEVKTLTINEEEKEDAEDNAGIDPSERNGKME